MLINKQVFLNRKRWVLGLMLALAVGVFGWVLYQRNGKLSLANTALTDWRYRPKVVLDVTSWVVGRLPRTWVKDEFLLKLAGIYQEREQWPEMVRDYQRVIDRSGATPEREAALGDGYLGMADLDQAEAAYRKALELDRTYVAAYPKLIRVLGMQERYKDALPYIELMISTNDKDIRWWLMKGSFNHMAGEEDYAQEAFDQVRELSGNDPMMEAAINQLMGEVSE